MRIDVKVFGTFELEPKSQSPFSIASYIPSIFFYKKAISAWDPSDITVTDDNMLMEGIGVRVYMTDVGKNNLKITYAEDVFLAECLLEKENE